MDRPSALAFRRHPARPNNFRFGSRTFLRVAVAAFALAFVHVWESVTLSELRTRVDRERARTEAQELRLRQLTSQLAQWGARTEASAGAASRLGFTIPGDGQVVLLSASLAGGSRTRLASAPKSRSLWDWVAGAAEAGSRGHTRRATDEDTSLP